jgi:hypothetical protein
VKAEGRLRWAIFTASVVSAIDNPEAYLWRVLGSRLREIGHEAFFFEPRGNEPVRALLHRSGSRALKEFSFRHPDVEYRTLEPRKGADLVEWMTRTLATVDVAVIQSNVEPDLINWMGQLTRPHLQTFFLDSGWSDQQALSDALADQIRTYTAVLVGDERLVSSYAQIVPRDRVLSFGPLLPVPQTEDLTQEAVADLERACDRLIDIITARRIAESTQRRSQIGPNGHRSS